MKSCVQQVRFYFFIAFALYFTISKLVNYCKGNSLLELTEQIKRLGCKKALKVSIVGRNVTLWNQVEQRELNVTWVEVATYNVERDILW